MSIEIHPNSLANLKPIPATKGEVRNPYGRGKKLICQYVAEGYTRTEINDTITQLLALSIDQLDEISKDKQATALEASISSAIVKGYRKGNLDAIETVISRRYGKAKESIEITVSPELIAARNMFFALVHQERIEQAKALEIVIDAANKNGFMLNPADITSTDVKGI